MTSLAIENPIAGLSKASPLRLLCGPGPANVHPRVQASMTLPQVGHMDPEFFNIVEEVKSLLRYAWQTKNHLTFPISGTGTAAWETIIANTTSPGDVHLVCVNGYFGERHCDMAARYGAIIRRIDIPWGEAFTLDQIEEAIELHTPNLVWICAGETSTGVLQPLDGIGALCRKAGNTLFMVDTVTVLSGHPIRLDSLLIDLAYSAAQKCLGCPSGISQVTIGPRAVEKMKKMRAANFKPSNWYLDIELLEKYWCPAVGEPRIYHHTASSALLMAMREALVLLAEEGLEACWARHAAVGKYFRKLIQDIGLKMFVKDASHRLDCMHTVCIPPEVDGAEVIRYLRTVHGIEIGGGLGKAMSGKVWRIGLMGFNCRDQVALQVASALQEALKVQGWKG